MKRNRSWKGILGISLSLLLLCGIIAPQALAYEDDDDYEIRYDYQYDEDYDDDDETDAAEDDDPYAYVPITQRPTEDTMIGTVDELTGGSDTGSAESENDLSSENWDALLGVPGAAAADEDGLTTSDASETESGWMFGGNASSDGGLSRIFIVAIIAFAVGAVGITFFVYSQFIYKAKLRRKAAESGAFADMDEEETEEPQQAETAVPAADTPREQVVHPQTPDRKEPPEPAEPVHPSSLSKEDQDKLQEVDWDKFFSDDF